MTSKSHVDIQGRAFQAEGTERADTVTGTRSNSRREANRTNEELLWLESLSHCLVTELKLVRLCGHSDPSSFLDMMCERASFSGRSFSLFLDKRPGLQLGAPEGGLQNRRKGKGRKESKPFHSFIHSFIDSDILEAFISYLSAIFRHLDNQSARLRRTKLSHLSRLRSGKRCLCRQIGLYQGGKAGGQRVCKGSPAEHCW